VIALTDSGALDLLVYVLVICILVALVFAIMRRL
jgi:hypothetical protein